MKHVVLSVYTVLLALAALRPLEAAQVCGTPGKDGPFTGGGTVNEKDKSFKLDTDGTAYRYYLVWITELAEGAKSAEISEIRLSQKVPA